MISAASFLAIHMTCLETSCTVLPFYKTLGLQVCFTLKKRKKKILTHIDAELRHTLRKVIPRLILPLFAFSCLTIISEASRLSRKSIPPDWWLWGTLHVLSWSVAVNHLLSSHREFLKVVVFVVVLAQTGCAIHLSQHRKRMNRCADSGILALLQRSGAVVGCAVWKFWLHPLK